MVSARVMHIPGVIETKKAVGIKAPIRDRLNIVNIRNLVAAHDTKRFLGHFVSVTQQITENLLASNSIFGMGDLQSTLFIMTDQQQF